MTSVRLAEATNGSSFISSPECSDMCNISIPAVVSQEEDSPSSSSSDLSVNKCSSPMSNDKNAESDIANEEKKDLDLDTSKSINGEPLIRTLRSTEDLPVTSTPPKKTQSITFSVPTPPRRSPRRHSFSSLPAPSLPKALSIREPATTRRSPRKRQLKYPPLAPSSTRKQKLETPQKSTIESDEKPNSSTTSAAEPNESTPPNRSELKPLIAKTPLRGDGTPMQPLKDRTTYDSPDEGEDDNSFLPTVSSTTISSPLLKSRPVDSVEANKASEKCESTPIEESSISTRELHDRMVELFPSFAHKRVANVTCVAARLFAGFSLSLDSFSRETKPSKKKRSRRQVVAGKAKDSIDMVKPILPLLAALVDLELSLLRDDSEKPHQSILSTRQAASRRVHFAAFDGSALQPPSDVLENSHHHQQAAADQLEALLQTLEKLRDEESMVHLRKLHKYLTGPKFSPADSSTPESHLLACSESLSGRFGIYPACRVQRAAKSYAMDLERVIQFHTDESPKHSLSWHTRMADTSAQLVRYWLRTELNPVPGRAAEESSSSWNLRVCDYISLVGDDQENAAIDDGSLSSLVSNAASHVFDHFGDDWSSWKKNLEQTPTTFLKSDFSKQGIAPSKRRRDSGPFLKEWTQNDWSAVENEIDSSTKVLAAINGATFLYELLSIVVGLEGEFWTGTVQKSAEQLHRCPLASIQPEDQHLNLLRWSPQTLLEQLPAIIDWSRKSSCEEALINIESKFLFGTDAQKKRRKRAYQPYVGHVEAIYEQAMCRTCFPSVQLSEDVSDDEEMQ